MTDKIVCWKHFHRQMICFGGFMINQSSGRNFFGYKFFDDCSVSFSFLATCYLFCIPPLYIWFFFFYLGCCSVMSKEAHICGHIGNPTYPCWYFLYIPEDMAVLSIRNDQRTVWNISAKCGNQLFDLCLFLKCVCIVYQMFCGE